MIIPNKPRLNDEELKTLQEVVAEFGCKIGAVPGETRTIYPIIGDESSDLMIQRIEGLDFIDHVARIQESYKLMARASKLEKKSIMAGNVEIGREFKVFAGHCTIDPKNPNLFYETAAAVKEAGVDMLRGGVWKPRTNPHSFQGDDKSLDILIQARQKTGLPVVTEVMDEEQLRLCVNAGVDMLQVGARNALNYGLLKAIGRATQGKNIAVLLKRSIHMGPMDEFISAAEYIAAEGNPNIALCPRGTLPKTDGFRNNPDESITMLLKEKTWAPVVVDPSHSVGRSDYVPRAALAAASYGADGVIIETHIDSKKGIGDDPKQAVKPGLLAQLIVDLKAANAAAKRYPLK